MHIYPYLYAEYVQGWGAGGCAPPENTGVSAPTEGCKNPAQKNS